MEKGQKVWVKVVSHRGVVMEPKEATISKVGNKYFELENDRSKYFKATLLEAVEYGYSNRVYFSLQDILDENEQNSLSKTIREAFSSYGKLPYSLDQLREIIKIINPK